MKITPVGIDLAKNVIKGHGGDEHGKAVLRKAFKRYQLFTLFCQTLRRALIGMKVCSSADFWAKMLQALGYTVRLLMAPQFVKHYVKTNKNYARDAKQFVRL